MLKSERCSIRRLVAGDLESLLGWRNHPDVRRFMLTQHEITIGEHRDWFERFSRDPSHALLIGEDRGFPIGFVHFSRVAPQSAADWGFYAAPGAPAGSGSRLCATALDFAFQQLALHKVCGQALDNNQASVHLHARLGFRQEGVLREQHLLGDKPYDLICYGLLRREWI